MQTQRLIPVATQNAPSYDVLVAADESEVFGGYLPYRTYDARPVAGSGGLKPTSWDPSHEQWGAAQLQNRFFKLASRGMNARGQSSLGRDARDRRGGVAHEVERSESAQSLLDQPPTFRSPPSRARD